MIVEPGLDVIRVEPYVPGTLPQTKTSHVLGIALPPLLAVLLL